MRHLLPPDFEHDGARRSVVLIDEIDKAPRDFPNDLERILVLRERRTLSKNLTLSYHNVIYQITTTRAAYTMRGAHVEVREASDGRIGIEYKGKSLAYRVFSEQEQRQARVTPSKQIDAALSRPAQTRKRQTYHPPMSHPWRYFDYSEKSMEAMERRGDICILRK